MEVTLKKNNDLQLAIFKIGEEEFGVDISQVIEIIKPASIIPIPEAPNFIEGVMDSRGKILTVIDLAKRLNLSGRLRSEKNRIIVVGAKENIVGMIVDEVTEVARLSRESIDKLPDIVSDNYRHTCINGIGRLGQGRLLILIDLAEVLTLQDVESIKEILEKKNRE